MLFLHLGDHHQPHTKIYVGIYERITDMHCIKKLLESFIH